MIEPGEVVGHYRILERIGSGGMGVVFRAEDLTLGREVAIKVLSRDAVGTEAIARFRREARTLSGLNHPHICTVHEFGEHEGQPYLVMELLHSATLADLISAGPIAEPRLIVIAAQVAGALAAAHGAGLVHRDIKPANITVSATGDVKILDFGLAKVAAAPREDVSTITGAPLTQAGLTIGTVAYMSPEQARGESVDARSDLFSLGAVLYEMATGRRAFEGGSTIRTLEAVLRDTPPAPRTLNPALSPGLERIIVHALEKDAARRYQRAEEMRRDLDALSHSATSASAKPAHPRRRAQIGAGVAVLAMLALAIWLVSSRRAPALTDKDTLLITDVDNTSGDAVVDGALRQAIAIDLEQSPFLSLVGDDRLRETLKQMGRADARATRETLHDLCERTGAAVAVVPSVTELGSAYVVSLEAISGRSGDVVAREQAQAPREQILTAVSQASARMRGKLGESAASIERFDVPLSDATTPSLEALRAYSRGRELLMLSRHEEAVPFLKNAITLDPNFASAYSALAIAYGTMARTAPEVRSLAREAGQRAYDLRGRVSEKERYAIDYSYFASRGDYVAAKEPLELAVQTYPRHLPFHNNLAFMDGKLGQFEDGVREARAALAINAKAATPAGNLAWELRALGRYDEVKQVAADIKAAGGDSSVVHSSLYLTAVAQGDEIARQGQLAWSKGRSEEGLFRAMEAERALSEGRVADAVAAASGPLVRPFAATLAVDLALSGACAEARRLLDASADQVQAWSGIAVGWCGDTARVREMIPRIEALEGQDTSVHVFGVPLARAALALHDHSWSAARQELAPALPYAFGAGYEPTYFLALSHLGEGNAADAMAAFQQILDRPGADPVSVVYPLSLLGMARAAALAHDTARSRRAYETLLARWQKADASFAPLAQARAEYARVH